MLKKPHTKKAYLVVAAAVVLVVVIVVVVKDHSGSFSVGITCSCFLRLTDSV